VPHGQYLPPDPSKGDESTVAGYVAVHARPAALEGRDGFSYSIEILSDSTGDAVEPFGAYLMFVQWSRLGAQKVEGHVESDFLAWGASVGEAEGLLGAMKLAAAQEVLDGLLRTRDGANTRRWWSATDAASEAGADGSGAN
jgi:FAD/FMN-containing dehydrogenase